MLSAILFWVAISLLLTVGLGFIIHFIVTMFKDEEYVGGFYIIFLLVLAILLMSSLVLGYYGM